MFVTFLVLTTIYHNLNKDMRAHEIFVPKSQLTLNAYKKLEFHAHLS